VKRTKIVYLNTRFVYNRSVLDLEQDEKWFYLFGMGHFLAWEVLKKNPEILVENWRADHTITELKENKVEGVMCRVFPCKNRAKFGDFSLELIRELKVQARQFRLVIHFMGMYSYFYDYIAWSLRKRAALAATHLGGPHPLWKFQRTRKLKHWMYYFLQKFIIFPSIGHVFCTTETLRGYVAGIIGDEKVSKTPIFGVDMNVFRTLDKKESRLSLGFPLDKKVVLQVGRAMRYRGVDLVLEMWKNIRSDRYYIFFVDTEAGDDLFSKVQEANIPFCGNVSFFDLAKYYSAADVLVYLPFDEESLNFAGTSYVPLEAMACGTSVVAPTLRHFPDEKIYSVCRVPMEKQQVNEMVLDLLENPPDPDKCRSLVQKHYNWDAVISRHLEIYEKLLADRSS
jgi:glycosyltransferase involved in cell wall biosynthesis